MARFYTLYLTTAFNLLYTRAALTPANSNYLTNITKLGSFKGIFTCLFKKPKRIKGKYRAIRPYPKELVSNRVYFS